MTDFYGSGNPPRHGIEIVELNGVAPSMGGMFSDHSLVLRLPDKTLAFTYDDGPGPRTMEIAEFLHQRGIPATFFVVGRHVREQPDVVRKVRNLGHTIANHSNTHRDLTKLIASPDLLTEEVLDADRCIREFIGGDCFLFRAPYGKWTPQVAQVLNQSPELHKYLGPVRWDIEFGDYEIGSRSDRNQNSELYTLEQCRDAYMDAILARSAGVLLLHDWSADPGARGDELRRNNRTFELTQQLVDRLAGFKFASLGGMRVFEG